MSPSSKPSRTLRLGLAYGVAWVSATAACGYDGRATQETSSAAVGPSSGAPDGGSQDGGPEASEPILTCSDLTLSFDGIDDAATVPDDAALDVSKDFTVEAWIKPSATVTSDAEMDVVSHHDAATSDGWVLRLKSGRVEIVVYGSDPLGARSYSAGNGGAAYVVPGKWSHIAGTLQGDTLRVYYDGVLRDSQTLGFLFRRDTYTGGGLRLGRAAASTRFPYQGGLDDVRISKIARYTDGTAPKPTAALPIDESVIGVWRFDEPSGNVLLDAAMHNHDGSLAPDATAAARVAAPCIANR